MHRAFGTCKSVSGGPGHKLRSSYRTQRSRLGQKEQAEAHSMSSESMLVQIRNLIPISTHVYTCTLINTSVHANMLTPTMAKACMPMTLYGGGACLTECTQTCVHVGSPVNIVPSPYNGSDFLLYIFNSKCVSWPTH